VVPVGGVLAFKNRILIAGAGYDIGCGNMAVKTNVSASDLLPSEWYKIADELEKTLTFGIGKSNTSSSSPTDHEIFEDERWEAIPKLEVDRLKKLGRNQLGTIGSGNHFVNLYIEPSTNAVWVAVHFGSRGLGWNICNGFNSWGSEHSFSNRTDLSKSTLVDTSDKAQHYLTAMHLAGDYAKIGRAWVIDQALKVLGAKTIYAVHNHHNFIWKETHPDIGTVWVHRKGATPAHAGQISFIGSSMTGPAHIVMGKVLLEENSEARILQKALLSSTVHGTGRLMSRTQARGKFRTSKTWYCRTVGCTRVNERFSPSAVFKEDYPKCPVCKKDLKMDYSFTTIAPPQVGISDLTKSVRDANVILRGGGVDEAPVCYRKMEDVMKLHASTIDVLHTLKPRVVLMAPSSTFDPYKD